MHDMNMKLLTNLKKLVFVWIFLNVTCLSYSAYHSIITLKNGSVIKGDIVVQRVGKDLTIETSNATFEIDPKEIVSKTTRNVKYEDLSRDMKRWVLENRALKGDAYGRYAELEDIKTERNTYSGLISKSQDLNNIITYVQVSPSIFNIKWSDIKKIDKNISKNSRNKTVDEVITNSNKSYVGSIVSQKMGEDITIETSKGNITIPNNDVMEIRLIKSNGTDNMPDYIDYTNIIVLKDGKEKEGLITAHHYGKKATENYVTLLTKNGETQIILNSDITELRIKYDKRELSSYIPGNVYLNEFKIDKARSERVTYCIVFLEKQVFPFPEGIEISFKSEGDKFLDNWTLISLREMSTSDGKFSWGYDIREKGENTIPYKSQDSVMGIGNITFGYLSPGYYALVNKSDTEAFLFKITK